MPIEELPFVAELIDMAPGEDAWRQAAEVTLGIRRARHARRRDPARAPSAPAIDPLRIPVRIHFEGVAAGTRTRTWPATRASSRASSSTRTSPFSALGAGPRAARRTSTRCCVARPGRAGRRRPPRHPERADPQRQARRPRLERRPEAHHRVLQRRPAGRALGRARRAGRDGRQLIAGRAAAVGAGIAELRGTEGSPPVRARHRLALHRRGRRRGRVAEKKAELERVLANSDVLRGLKDEEERLVAELESAQKLRHVTDLRRPRRWRRAGIASSTARMPSTTMLDRIEREQAVTLWPTSTPRTSTPSSPPSATPDDLDGFAAEPSRGCASASPSSRSRTERNAAERARHPGEHLRDVPEPLARPERRRRRSSRTRATSTSSTRCTRSACTSVGRSGSGASSEWSGQDLVPLTGAFDTAIEEIEDRLRPINEILATLPFGAGRDRLKISLRRLHRDDSTAFRKELKALSSGATERAQRRRRPRAVSDACRRSWA